MIDIDYGEYLVPLLITKKNGTDHTIDRYAGVAFFIGNTGLLATCKHIIDMVQDDESIIVKNINTQTFEVIENIKTHPTKDFAIGYLSDITNYKSFKLDSNEYSIGYDIQAFGFTSNHKQNGTVHIDARFRKGYIVRTSPRALNNDSNSLIEISFPSEKGFSGTPIISTTTKNIVGMLYGNSESSILQSSLSEVEENGDKFTEKITKIVEFGLAHSNIDIQQYLVDMQVES